MQIIPDDPIISSLLRTGAPPWMQEDPGYEEDDVEETEAEDELWTIIPD